MTVSAEVVVLALCGVLLGDGTRKDRGLMSRLIDGEQHVTTCQKGLYVQAGDSLRGGQPCSERCLRAQDALKAAELWLRAHEVRPPLPVASQPDLFSEIAG